MERCLASLLLAAFAALCSIFAHSGNIPDYYSAPGKSKDRSDAQSDMDRIDPFSGSLNLSYVDMHLPGSNGFDININRIYRSLPGDPNLIGDPYLGGARLVTGLGWDIHMGRIWTYGNKRRQGVGCKTNDVSFEKSPVLETADGSRISLVDAKPGVRNYDLIGRNNWIAKCRQDGGFDVFDSHGTKYTYSLWGLVGIANYTDQNGVAHFNEGQSAYLVTEIKDTYGNKISVNYTSSSANYKVIDSVTSNDGRRVSFSYSNKSSSRALLKSISAHGRTVRYDYRAVPGSGDKSFLVKATPPEGRSWEYDYKTTSGAGRYSISKVTSPTKLTSEYTYSTADFDGAPFQKTTVVSKRKLKWGSNTAEWTYSYSPAGASKPVLGSFPSSMRQDVTTIKSPYYCEKYTHIGNQAITRSTNSGVSPYIFLVGTLTEKVQYKDKNCSHTLQRDLYEWGEIEISNQNNVQRRGLKVQEEYSFPVLEKRETRIDGDLYKEEYSNFDVYGNPGRIRSQGSKTKITTQTYKNDPSRWIIGLPKRTTISSIPGYTENFYNTQGSISRTEAYSVTTRYSYDIRGNVSTQTDPAGRVTRYPSYYAGKPTLVTYPDNSSVRSVVDRFGDIKSYTDQLNRTTTYTYDKLSRLKTITTPRTDDSNITLTYSYPYSGIKRTLTRGSFIEEKTYDARGSLITQVSEGITLKYRYDLLGRKDREYLPNSSSYYSKFDYDALGRTTKITNADNSAKTINFISNYGVKYTDELGRPRYQYFETFGNPQEKALKKSELPGGQRLTITRDNLLQPTLYNYATPTGSFNRRLYYNNKRFLYRENHPEVGDINYSHYNDGQVKTKKTGNQPVISYQYDSIGRLKNVDYPGDTPDETLKYDARGNLKELKKGNSLRLFDYDRADNLEKETLNITGGQTYSVEYGYNGLDALSYLIYPSGRRVNLNPDDLGRPKSLSGFISQIDYFPSGMLKRVSFQNGKSQTFTQSATRLWPKIQDVPGVARFDYSFDLKGNMKTMRVNQGPYPNLTMSYDSNDQLKKVVRGNTNEIFDYDYAHNIKTNNRGNQRTSLTYNSAKSQLSSIRKDGATSTVSYDDYGHIKSIGSDQAFLFGHDGNLKSFNADTVFAYDGAGNRYLKADNTKSREFFYIRSGLLIAEYDPAAKGGLEHFYLQKKRIASVIRCSSDVDTDNDGMSDCKELLRGRDPNSNPDDNSGGDNSGGDGSGGDGSGGDGSGGDGSGGDGSGGDGSGGDGSGGDGSGGDGSGGDGSGGDGSGGDGSGDDGPAVFCPNYDPSEVLAINHVDPSSAESCMGVLAPNGLSVLDHKLCMNSETNEYQLEIKDRRTPEQIANAAPSDAPTQVFDDTWECRDIIPIINDSRHQLCISPSEDAYVLKIASDIGCVPGDGSEGNDNPGDSDGGDDSGDDSGGSDGGSDDGGSGGGDGGSGGGGSGGNGGSGSGSGGSSGGSGDCNDSSLCSGGGGNDPVIITSRNQNLGKKED